jgi:hypothetical protein
MKMAGGLTRLKYDPAAASSSHSVGAYVLAGNDGDQIASQNVNSEDWLNTASILYDDSGSAINSGNPLPVEITSGVNVEVDLSHVDDSVRLGDGTNLLTSHNVGSDYGLDVYLINTEIAVTQGSDSPWTVDASQLDIDDLIHTTDSVALGDGSSNLFTSGNGASDDIVAANINALDVRNFNYGYDGTTWDRITAQNVAGAMDVYIAGGDVDDSLANTGAKSEAVEVSTSAVSVTTAAESARKWLCLSNEGNKALYWGGAGVTAAAGFPLHTGFQHFLRVGGAVDLKIIGETGASAEDLRTAQLW